MLSRKKIFLIFFIKIVVPAAATHGSLSVVLSAQVRMMRHALEVLEEALGPNHLDVANQALVPLAALLGDGLGLWPEANDTYLKAPPVQTWLRVIVGVFAWLRARLPLARGRSRRSCCSARWGTRYLTHPAPERRRCASTHARSGGTTRPPRQRKNSPTRCQPARKLL
jgi:hypothetical protein